MHGFDDTPSSNIASTGTGPWYKELTRYHWFVFTVAALGWMFDTMDQQLFTLARKPAMEELLYPESKRPDPAKQTEEEKKKFTAEMGVAVAKASGTVTAIFLMGWASGGLFFGVLGDRIGRAKTMLFTILIYSVCTGLSAFSVGFWDFAFYRFITGLGVGGEFAVGISLVAEVMPDRARPFALGLLQALSAIGNITAAVISMSFGHLEGSGAFENLSTGAEPMRAWRVMFLVGTLPALLAVFIRRGLKEPERWQAASHGGVLTKQLGSYAELFGDPRWRKNAILGLLLAFSGVVGLWGIGFFVPELISTVLKKRFLEQNVPPNEITSKIAFWAGMTMIMTNVGAFFGIYVFSRVTAHIGRRSTFAIFFVMALLSTASVFAFLKEFHQIFWMVPIMGFCQLALFGGYAIYFPELFPTRLRSTGTSFCYNVGRFVAALGPVALASLGGFYKERGWEEFYRPAGVTMTAIFLIGLCVLPFCPETKGKPLPE